MELDYFQVLSFLKSKNALNKMVSIEQLITEAIPNELSFEQYHSNVLMEQISRLLDKLAVDGNIKTGSRETLNDVNYNWDKAKAIMVELTQNGYLALHEHFQIEFAEKMNNALLEGNKSSIKTNNSIMKSNDASKIINELIASSNRAMANNSTIQTEVLKRQTSIFRFTAIFAFGALIISGFNLYIDVHKDTSTKQLQSLSKEIQSLHTRISRLRIDSSKMSKESKTSTKEN